MKINSSLLKISSSSYSSSLPRIFASSSSSLSSQLRLFSSLSSRSSSAKRPNSFEFKFEFAALSRTKNGCSFLSLILTKLLLLDISCENIFALSIVTVRTACPFSIKKGAKMSDFYVKTVKICWLLGA